MFLALSWHFSTGLSALILQAQVFLTVLFWCILLKESVKPNHLIGMITTGVGLALIGMGQYQGGFSLIGMLPVLGASLSWAIGNVIVKKSDKSTPYRSSSGGIQQAMLRPLSCSCPSLRWWWVMWR